jgi:hypothetical protein
VQFSKRFGFSGEPAEVRVREEAPLSVRDAILQIAEELEFQPSQLRTLLCRILRVAPHRGNWSEYPNIYGEVQDLLHGAVWFRVYDFVEAVYQYSAEHQSSELASQWQDEINEYFFEAGVGWQLVDGHLEVRGSESFEAVVRGGVETLREAAQGTASSELHEAIQDLSRRPAPDLTGAVQHAMAAFECVARDVTGDRKSTLGKILGKFPELLPKPLDSAVEQVWGYASERARHLREGNATDRDEAALIVGLSASIATYLVCKDERSR